MDNNYSSKQSFKQTKAIKNTLPSVFDIEDLVTLNEMIKKVDCKKTTFESIKRKIHPSTTAFIDLNPNTDQDGIENDHFETLFDKGYEADKIIGVTSIDDFQLLICYLIQYKGGQMELVPNKVAHRKCPKLVIEFLESRLIFSNHGKPDLSEEMFQGVIDENYYQQTDRMPDTNKQNTCNNNDDDNDTYVFDELSKYMNLDDFKMMQPDSEIDAKDFSKGALSINDFCQEEISEIECTSSCQNNNVVEIDRFRDFENEEIRYLSGLFDKKIDEDYEDGFIDEEPQNVVNLNDKSSLDEINHTLSLSKMNNKNQKDDNQELSPKPSNALDYLFMSEAIQGSSPQDQNYSHPSQIESISDLSEIPETQLYDRDQSKVDETNQYSFEI